MKKIKLIVPILSCLLTTALFSCAKNNEQPESDYYKISVYNDHKSPKVTFDSPNFIKKGEACDVLIRFEPYTYLGPISAHPDETYRLCKANSLSIDETLDKKCYSFECVSEDRCVWELKIPREYMTTSYDLDVNSTYVKGYNETGAIGFAAEGTLKEKASINVINTSVDSDLTFIIIPKDFQSGYTFDSATKDKITITGISGDGTNEVLEPSRKELVLCDSPIQGLGHYQTLAYQLRIAIPVSRLYEVDATAEYGYKQKFDKIEVRSSDAETPVSYNVEKYKKIFNPTVEACQLSSEEINLDDDGVHYIAKFSADSEHSFPETDIESLTDLSILPSTYVPTGRPYFREFEVHEDASKRKDITCSLKDAFTGTYLSAYALDYVFYDKYENTYLAMNKWLTPTVNSNVLTIDINITNMIKYIEFPISTIIYETDLYEFYYQDGSIDFIKSFNFTVKAIED